MQSTSALWKQIARSGSYTVEYKLELAGQTYGWSELTSFALRLPLFSAFSAGNTASALLSVALLPKGDIPKMAEIKCFKRLALGTARSEWLPQGVYYIDTRRKLYGNTLEIQAYDAMLKANSPWLEHTSISQWPASMAAAAQDIAGVMGVALDSRTLIKTAADYVVDYPNDYLMSEVLQFIAAAHGGNWVMSYEGKLRLVGLLDMPEETNYIIDGSDGAAILFGDTRIVV